MKRHLRSLHCVCTDRETHLCVFFLERETAVTMKPASQGGIQSQRLALLQSCGLPGPPGSRWGPFSPWCLSTRTTPPAWLSCQLITTTCVLQKLCARDPSGCGQQHLGFITVSAKTPGGIGRCQVRHDSPEKCQ